ncbi:MAG: DUF2953 domain-containing protein [Gammaproteobacteria bacterium]|nr:DUF2953 domain-containing protein [Gammaproteobacteria bacterium]MBT8110586.1 DUF2953 domain-containing protein [Gammaproteobacteria bacterium]NNL45286.1 DUF2953 domain-containing protein [Woeseiaceae bacterium]
MLIGIAIFLSLVVILLAIPVTLTYRLYWKQTLSANIRLRWAFGLVRTDVSPDNARAKADKPEAARKTAGRPDRPQARNTNFMAAIRQPSFRRRIIRFISDVWRAIHKKNVRLLVRMGLGDPADTGQLWAVLGPLSGVFASLRDIRIAIEPDFVDTTFEVDSSGTIRLIPLQFVILALGLLFSPPMWRGVMLMRTSG